MSKIIEVENKIVVLRKQQVLIDSDVAELYGVETKVINQAVNNNPEKLMTFITTLEKCVEIVQL